MSSGVIPKLTSLPGLAQFRRDAAARISSSGRIGTQMQHRYLQRRLKFSASASFVDFAFGDTVKDAVKSTFLDNAARKDSRLWRDNKPSHNTDTAGVAMGSHVEKINGGVNDPVCTQQDSLEEWGLDLTTKYWPDLPPALSGSAPDPFALGKVELDDLSRSIREDLLGTDHPVLNQAASYFFENSAGGKQVRPLMVLLLSRALADSAGDASNNELNGQSQQHLFSTPLDWQRKDLPDAQRRLAEISELIHTASLFHDDVIDGSDTRRGLPAVHKVFGNKVAILAGDYLLARASICLARLRHTDVIETMSTIIEHLVRGEIMQLRGSSPSDRNKERLIYYLRKNYYKTGSLMANSCKSTALLGGYSPEMVWASYRYGKHVGMAFQLVDDVLDFEGNVTDLGKPALADLNSGLATAPVLFAAEQYPELEALIDRKFKSDGDVDLATDLVFKSDGIERTKELARVHSELAIDALLEFGAGAHRDALINLSHKVVSRTK